MKIIKVGNETYARHWFRWYWVSLNRMNKLYIVEDDE